MVVNKLSSKKGLNIPFDFYLTIFLLYTALKIKVAVTRSDQGPGSLCRVWPISPWGINHVICTRNDMFDVNL